MSEPVTSGLGRRGPWLQNHWLRVETRLEDGSISPVSIDGSFRPAERALAWAQPLGEAAVHLRNADYDVRPFVDGLGFGRQVELIAKLPRERVELRREVKLYDAHPFCVTRLGLTNLRADPLKMQSLHAFTTPSEGRGRLRLSGPPGTWRVYRNGWQSWSPTLSFGGTERDVRSRPPDLAPEPPEGDAGTFASDDVGVLFDPASGRSLLAGAISARDFLSQVHLDVPARTIDARNHCDGLAVGPGETVGSERFLIDLSGHPNEQLARHGDALGTEMGARIPRNTPSGWCSWYYFFTQVTEDDVLRNLHFLERHGRELPIETVQIDDGYQADIGDWLSVNEKFPHGMDWLAAEIKRAGFTPGIWVAPFLLSESSATFATHPEWVIRGDDGEPIVATNNWGHRNFGLDGSNPAARAWLTDLFRRICDGWGYDYVKIDFLYAAALQGRRVDDGATRIRAYRAALQAVRDGVGPDRFILGCGSLMAPSVGFFDGNRIGPDVAPFWRFLTREERTQPEPRPRTPDDALSVETAIRNTLTRSWMHRRLWANDPDCLLVRTDRTKLTLDETQTLATAIGLTGGMMLSSDDLELVPPERIEMLSMLLPPLPYAGVPTDLIERDMPEQLEVVAERAFDPVRLVGLFNFTDVQRDLVLGLPAGRWHAFELWSSAYLGQHEGRLTLPGVAAHGCKVVALRPAHPDPCLLGTDAHIGCGLVDVRDQRWDGAKLTLRLDGHGRRNRRVWVGTQGRPVIRAAFNDAAVSFRPQQETCAVDLVVDEGGMLEISFERG